MSHPSAVTSATFQAQVLDADRPVLVDFWAPWCGPCRAMKPALAQAAEALAATVTVLTLDIDESPEVAQRYAITSVPTLALFQHGELVYLWTGARRASEIVDAVNLAL